MLKLLFPVILLLVGSGLGVGAGLFLRPAPADTEMTDKKAAKGKKTDTKAGKSDAKGGKKDETAEVEYVKLNNQFVVPIVENREVVAMVVMSLSVEVSVGSKEAVFRREPKLRDSFLQVMFDHANVGGFDGAFTDANNLAVLRRALLEVGQRDVDPQTVKDVLILEIARQDY